MWYKRKINRKNVAPEINVMWSAWELELQKQSRMYSGDKEWSFFPNKKISGQVQTPASESTQTRQQPSSDFGHLTCHQVTHGITN